MARPDAILTTRSTPKSFEWSLLLKVNSDKWQPAREITPGVTYAEFDIGSDIDKPRINDGLGAYVLTSSEDVASEDESDPAPWQGFWFAKPRTSEEAAAPFETTYEEEFYSWPLIIAAVTFRSFTPYPVFGNDQWYITQDYYEPYDGLTKIKIEKFLSITPFDITATLSPQPSSIWWNFGPSENGSTAPALHPEIIVPPTYFDAAGPTYATREFYTHAGDYGDPPAGAGTPESITKFPAVTFAATAETTWVDHVVRTKTTKVNGLHYMERHTAIAPASTGPLVRKILGVQTSASGISV